MEFKEIDRKIAEQKEKLKKETEEKIKKETQKELERLTKLPKLLQSELDQLKNK